MQLHGAPQLRAGGCRATGRAARAPAGHRVLALPVAAETAVAAPEDKWIARTLTAVKGVGAPSGAQKLRSESVSALASLRMPTTRNEEYRYTDMAVLTKSTIKPSDPAAAVSADLVSSHVFAEAASSVAVVVNGVLRPELSRLEGLPKGVYVGPLNGAPAGLVSKLGELSRARGGPFAVLNGATAHDVLCVAVPAGVNVEKPLYCLYLSSTTSSSTGEERALSAPRLLLHADRNSSIELVEEYASTSGTGASGSSSSGGGYFTCHVGELFLEEYATVKHGYVEREAGGAVHVKGTLVRQAAHSSYTALEARLGGSLSRHDLGIEQTGPGTQTTMRHFLLVGPSQLHDLHSKLELNHPEGKADQLHKCIVTAASGRGVFDGNVKVNKRAQKTDAGQLSRNLLLVPRATVNVKPNLQIIADDVKCTHGCAVSDLSDEELFYFRARGIDAATARQALVNSFGAAVTGQFKYPGLVSRIAADVRAALTREDVEGKASAGVVEVENF